jgi:hypothetical protein
MARLQNLPVVGLTSVEELLAMPCESERLLAFRGAISAAGFARMFACELITLSVKKPISQNAAGLANLSAPTPPARGVVMALP